MIQQLCWGMMTVGLVLMLVFIILRRAIRSVELRITFLLVTIMILTAACLLYLNFRYRISPDILVSIFLVELGLFAYIYDAYRTFESISRTLKNLGSIYIFSGIVCLMSSLANFIAILWIIPVLLFSMGYFFTRRRRGLGNLCKGLGVLISVGFIASMVYDVREGVSPAGQARLLQKRLLPDIIKPSIIEELNTLNGKLNILEGEKKRLTSELMRVQADKKELEKASAKAEDALKQMIGEKEKLEGMLRRETAARAEAERRLAEVVKNKEGTLAVEGKLAKAIAERDGIKAELESLKSASQAASSGAKTANSDVELRSLKSQIKEKDEEHARLVSEVSRLKETVEKVKLALTPEKEDSGAAD